ncbi:Cytochrome P450 monooxygenase vrtE [Apiospora phragmitis]|uniref:Cytochrome P450 monooxygenase vrtE n=1 Tax=Apiospora phragmitis TaxID=2905665 RepID=A0ABR1VC84_9PEZI
MEAFQLLISNPRPALIALVAVPCLTVAVWWTISYIASPLRQYPGPFLAETPLTTRNSSGSPNLHSIGWTNWWRFFLVRTGSYHIGIKKLHEKHGPVVRIGPNTLDIDYPELSKTLCGTDGKWKKVTYRVQSPKGSYLKSKVLTINLQTEFYQNNSAIVNGKITYHLFSETNQANHARMKRPIVQYYSASSVLSLEPLMDKVIADFCRHLETRFMGDNSKAFDLGEWIAFCSWDINVAASYSQRFGYMDKGHDYDHTISIADKSLDYFAAVGQIPILDFLLDKNPVMRVGPPNLGNITRISLEHLIARLQGKDANFDPEMPEFLQHFVDTKQTSPDLVDDGIIMGYLLVNLLAGADTTAIIIRAIFYYALREPRAYRKLEEEILHAAATVQRLPQAAAVVREATRLHPGVYMLLERYVPAPGLTLPDGRFVPAGVAVGINLYVAGRNACVWGADADVYRPERWLRGHAPGAADESEDEYRRRLRRFHAADLMFGGGSHVCIGRHLAQLEVYKVIATIVRRYHVELEDPAREWEVTGSWFTRQKGLRCRLRVRSS